MSENFENDDIKIEKGLADHSNKKRSKEQKLCGVRKLLNIQGTQKWK